MSSNSILVTIHLNARLQPIDRGDWLEDPLDILLKNDCSGEVTGGGTQLAPEPAGIESCDMEVRLDGNPAHAVRILIAHLEKLGVPRGSRLIFESGEPDVPVGSFEGLAIFLNGTDLPAEVYRDGKVEQIIDECNRLLGLHGACRSHWQGASETALYFYGTSFETMNSLIRPAIATIPLCQKARIERIA